MDYSRLRAAALRDGEDEEAVTVDTRALIDKVLARYAGEWTTLRELIQNAADAQANTVKIKWETLPSTSVPLPSTTSRSEILKHIITNHTLRRLVVQNDGQPFSERDWGRLKRIAEGNPDETKIGAFGVGFYSVFADCEEPLISSGSEAMAFYWKGNALFTRKLQLPAEQAGPDTAFVLDYRNTTTPLPNLLSVGQFLATSLTFVALQHVEFWIDDYQVLALHKKTSPSVEVPISKDLETRTRDGLMRLISVERTSAQIDATFMSVVGWKPQASGPSATSKSSAESYWAGLGSSSSEMPSVRNFFSRFTAHATQSGLRGKAAKEEKAAQDAIAEDLTVTSSSSIFLRVTTGQIRTQVSPSFASELERATKKPPPKTTKLAILTSSYDEAMASETSSSATQVTKAVDVFSSVLPSKKPGGRIFIGFPTTQTTGAGMHISAPSVIPTVEREAIDLNARWVRTWNTEMLRVAGMMTRLAFGNEMADLGDKVKRMASENGKKGILLENVLQYVPEALHILKTYSFGDSTPSGLVAQIIEEAFWTSYKRPTIEVYSSQGVLPTSKVRAFSEDLSKFVNGIPVILSELRDAPFIKKLTDFGLIDEISVDDVCQELGTKALDKTQLHHFIAWVGKGALVGELDPVSRQRLLDVAVATVGDDESGEIIALGTITHYLNTGKIPPTLPIPPTTLPSTFTVNIPVNHLQALGWEPLELVPWLRFLIEAGPHKDDSQNLVKASEFAVKVLTVLSKNWDNLSASSRGSVVSALQNMTCIPTKMGMRRPAESFFPSVRLFDDLPTVQGCNGVKDKFLAALGVRKTVDLETIFTRLLNTSPEDEKTGRKKWSHMELIKYLASVRDDIPADDLKKLKESRLCPAEAGPPGLGPAQGTTQLFKVSELYEPKDSLRELKLPVLQWIGPPGSYRQGSAEGRFLHSLGLRSHPSVPDLVDMMASADAELRVKAMAYYTANHQINGYSSFPVGATNKAIMPLEGDEKRLVPPCACYTNEGAAVLGYNILRKELHGHAIKFGVARDPLIAGCVDRLVAKPPRDAATATKVFGYFTSRLTDLGTNELAKLRDARIVPVAKERQPSRGLVSKGEKETVFNRPVNCFLGSSSSYEDIFDFVDFGPHANSFLSRCGAKDEPSKIEIAQFACGEPARLLGVLQSPERYLNLLRSLADDLALLKRDRELFRKMKTSAFLLGFREISAPSSSQKEADPTEDEAPIKQYQLAAPSQIVILDDYISYRHFKNSLLCAPEEDALEAFYMALGSETLGSKVQEDVRIGSHADKQDGAVWLRNHALERSKLFLHEYAKYKPDAIKHDAKWLEKNLSVAVVGSLALRRSLRGHAQSHTEKRSAASVRHEGAWVLYVAADQGRRPDMYQVGQAICQLLLSRPSQQAYFFFEPFLKLDLLDLRARGYNVDRILRAKAAEARIAEEERRKALQAEQERAREEEKEWARNGLEREAAEAAVLGAGAVATAAAKQQRSKMPGSFDDDDDAPSPPAKQPQRNTGKKGLFSNLSRRLGFDTEDEPPEAQRHLDKFLPDLPDTPPSLPPGATDKGGGKKPGWDDGRVTSPAVVHQNLLNAIQSTRPHDSTRLFAPPATSEVKEQTTYCDSTPAANISFVAEAPAGTRVFLARDLHHNSGAFLGENRAAITRFEGVLRDVAAVYSVPERSLHIFYDAAGGTIAFNHQGSLFCNLRFFVQLHDGKLGAAAGSGGQARVEAATWWFVVLAHELAHNLVSPHNSEHSYYTESFLQMYFSKMMARCAGWLAADGGAAVGGGGPGSTRGGGGGGGAAGGVAEQRPLPPPPPPYSTAAGPTVYRSLLD